MTVRGGSELCRKIREVESLNVRDFIFTVLVPYVKFYGVTGPLKSSDQRLEVIQGRSGRPLQLNSCYRSCRDSLRVT